MTSTRATAAPILTPEQVDQLVVQPLVGQSVALQVTWVVPLSNSSLRVPVVTADPTAAWTAEGAAITPSDGAVAEVDITPSALKGLTIITSELAHDSSPAAAAVVGDGLVRDLSRQIDARSSRPRPPHPRTRRPAWAPCRRRAAARSTQSRLTSAARSTPSPTPSSTPSSTTSARPISQL